MAPRIVSQRKSRRFGIDATPLETTHPFHTDQTAATYEQRAIFDWHGARVQVSETSPALVHQQSKNVGDVVFVMMKGIARDYEGEIDGSGFRFDVTRPGQASICPLATSMDISIRLGRIQSCELYFPQRFAQDDLGFADERPLALDFARSDPFLFHAAQRLVALGQRDDDISVMQKESLLRTLALHLYANCSHEAATQPMTWSQQLTTSRAHQMREYIGDELHRRLSNEELALVSGFGGREFTAIFRNTFGTTPAQYIIDRRLDRAVQLLKTTTRDIADIALDTGFSSQSHLTTALRKRRGVTPHQLRRRTALFLPH